MKIKKLKPKIAIWISMILTICICLSSLILIDVSNKINYNSKQLTDNIERQWRSYMHDLLEELEKKLLTAVNTGQIDAYDEVQINKTIIDNLPFINWNGMINNFAIVNIGYHVRDEVLDLQFSMIDGSLVDDGVKTTVNESYDYLLQNVSDKNIKDIIIMINQQAMVLHEKYNFISTHTFKQMFMNAILLDKNSISSSNVQLDQIEQIYNDECWTESIVIPDGILGFNNESPYIDNEKNPLYRKISIHVSVDKNKVMENYTKFYNETEKLVNISISLLILITVFCVFIIAILFAIVIKTNGGVYYDSDYNHEDIDSDNADNIYIDGIRT